MHRSALVMLAGIVALMFASAGVSAGPPAARATATATCRDGGGVVWNLRSSWGAPYPSHGERPDHACALHDQDVRRDRAARSERAKAAVVRLRQGHRVASAKHARPSLAT